MTFEQVINVPSPTVQWGPWAIPLAALPIIFFVIKSLSSRSNGGSESTQGPPPGWYDDPRGSGRERWWDGSAWGDQTRGGITLHPDKSAADPHENAAWCTHCHRKTEMVGSMRVMVKGYMHH